MDKIVLNDGTEIENGIITRDMTDKQIFIEIPGTNIVDAMFLFGDPNKTQKMICYIDVRKFTFAGYTTISSASLDPDGTKLHVYMTGENGHREMEYTVPEIYLPKEMRSGNGAESNESA